MIRRCFALVLVLSLTLVAGVATALAGDEPPPCPEVDAAERGGAQPAALEEVITRCLDSTELEAGEKAIYLFMRGQNRLALSDWPAAEADLSAALADFEGETLYASVLTMRGFSRLMQGKQQAGLQDIDEALRLNPFEFTARELRAGYAMQTGHPEAAIEDMDMVLQFDPTYVGGYVGRGLAKQAAGDQPGAQEDFARARELDPTLDLSQYGIE